MSSVTSHDNISGKRTWANSNFAEEQCLQSTHVQYSPIRCSSLDALFNCTPSVLDRTTGKVWIKNADRSAVIGHAVHSYMADMIRGREVTVSEVSGLHGLTLEEEPDVAELVQYGERAWAEISRFMPDPWVELPVKGTQVYQSLRKSSHWLDGTIDVMSQSGANTITFLDWKTGWEDTGYHNQMAGYASCIADQSGIDDIVGIVVFLRHGYYRVVHYTPQRIADWEGNLHRNVLGSSFDLYKPGRQCSYCPNFYSCEARKEITASTVDVLIRGKTPESEFGGYIQRAKALLMSAQPGGKELLEPELAAAASDILYLSKLIEQQAESGRDLVRSLIERIGPIKMSPNTKLGFSEVKVRRLDPEKAMPVLENELGRGDLNACLKISLPMVLNRFSSLQAKGNRLQARSLLEQRLKDAGAVTVTTQNRLQEIVTDEESHEPSGNTAESTRPK